MLILFCAPLFVGLNGWDLHNDESIYSYAVDRIVETGEWLTPRAIPLDGPFLEKPPLKFWIVAAGIRSGLLPHDEIGLRFFDALFGSIAFVYVFLFGRWIGGVGCGFVSVLMLFTIDSLLFEHGLRSNNMEGALFLAYCGGMYHFARWVEMEGRPKAHAIAVGAFFALGFMTKFVAVFFMPLAAVAALLWRRDGWRQWFSRWRDWIVPAALVLLACAPWFVYQTVVGGNRVWREMFGVHVYERFTAALDPGHLAPWYYYFYWTWDEVTFANSEWMAVAGLLMLAVKAWTGHPWAARLILLWFVLPYALISMTTSKVFHYAFPFFPPMAIGAGWLAVTAFRVLDRWLERGIEKAEAASGFRVPALPIPVTLSRVLFAGALVMLGVAIWTDATGPLRLEIGGVELRNSSIRRATLIGLMLLALAGMPAIRRVAAMAAVAFFLPVATYALQAEHTMSLGRPLQVLRDCAKSAPESQRETGVYVPYERLRNHMFFYYPRQIGPWRARNDVDYEDLGRRLYESGQQTLVMMPRADYEAFAVKTGRRTPGLGLSDDVILLTPGPFAVCGGAALAAGGTDIGGVFHARTRH